MERDLLYDFQESNKSKQGAKSLVTGLYITNIFLSLIVFLSSLYLAGTELRGKLISNINIPILVIERLLPWIAIFLFIKKKQIGWILLFILSFVDCLIKGAYLVGVLSNLEEYLSVSPFLLIVHPFVFLYVSIIPVLLFYKSIQSIFNINPRIKICTVLIALVLFIVLKFDLANLLTGFKMKHGTHNIAKRWSQA